MKKTEVSGINRHHILTIDSARAVIYEFNENGEVVFELPTYGAGFDVWYLPDGTYMYCHLGPDCHGVRIVDKDNNVLTDYRTSNEVFGCQPLPDGNILVGELTEKRLTEVTRNGEIVKVIKLRCDIAGHEAMRMARKRPDGTYLVNQPGDCCIRRYASDGRILQEIKTPGDTFAVIEDENGHIFYTAQTAIYETDENGVEVWRASTAELAEIQPRWLTGMELLSNGNLLVCNWLGHGCEGKGTHLFEINRDKKILWRLEPSEHTADLANMQELSEDRASVCYIPLK